MNLNNVIFNALSNFSDEIFLSSDDCVLSYKQVDLLSSYYASYFVKFRGDNIGIVCSKSVIPIIAIIGCIKAGKTYVPLSLKVPPSIIQEIMIVSEIEAIVSDNTSIHFLEKALENLSNKLTILMPDCLHSTDHGLFEKHNLILLNDSNESSNVHPFKVCDTEFVYLMFTSGSTGRPKGIRISQLNLLSYIENINTRYSFSLGYRFSQAFDLSFDLSVHDIFICLTNGGELHIMDEKDLLSPYKFILKKGINVWFSVPSLGMILEKQKVLKEAVFPNLRYVFFCGESLLTTTAILWQLSAPNAKIVNLYGPTETTIAITAYELPFVGSPILHVNGVVAIGRPFQNQKETILSEDGMNASEGELLLGGSQVSAGYYKDISNTEKSFIIDIYGNKWYKTGDLVRKDGDNLLFIGRLDSQIKWNGYRIELEQINLVCRNFLNTPDVYSIVINENNRLDKNGIYTFIHSSFEDNLNGIMNCFNEKLPSYMIPKKVVFIDTYPINKNGKIDLSALKLVVK